MIYDGESLVREIRAVAGLGTNEVQGYTKAELLAHAASVLRSRLLPMLVKTREEYCVQRVRIPIVPGQLEYRIPARAMGDRIRAIWWVDAQARRRKINLISPQDLHLYQPSVGPIQGLYLTATHLVTVGQAPDGSLEIWFPFRIGDLVLQTDARQIASLVPAAKTITFATAAPTSWAAATRLDVHSVLGGHDIKMYAEPIVSLDGPRTTLTLTNAIDGSTFGNYPLEIGDWVCLERQSALVGVPEELIPALARGVALRIAEGDHDADAMQHHQAELAQDLESAASLVRNRVQMKAISIKGRRSCLFGG